jgi:hypothetical protein
MLPAAKTRSSESSSSNVMNLEGVKEGELI